LKSDVFPSDESSHTSIEFNTDEIIESESPASCNGTPTILQCENNGKTKKRQDQNREAAKLFRKKQKLKTIELDKKMAELQAMNVELGTKIEFLFRENRELRLQLQYWRSVVINGVLVLQDQSPNSAQLFSFLVQHHPVLAFIFQQQQLRRQQQVLQFQQQQQPPPSLLQQPQQQPQHDYHQQPQQQQSQQQPIPFL